MLSKKADTNAFGDYWTKILGMSIFDGIALIGVHCAMVPASVTATGADGPPAPAGIPTDYDRIGWSNVMYRAQVRGKGVRVGCVRVCVLVCCVCVLSMSGDT